jgi:hypothetical protein
MDPEAMDPLTTDSSPRNPLVTDPLVRLAPPCVERTPDAMWNCPI